MTTTDWLWLLGIAAFALWTLRTAGNYYDDYIGTAIPSRWPGFRTYWWRKLRHRCQICGGTLRGSATITKRANGRSHRLCRMCIKLWRHAHNYDSLRSGGTVEL